MTQRRRALRERKPGPPREQSKFAPRACAATGCNREIHPTQVMCTKHWKVVPRRLRNAICDAYMKGTPASANTSSEWFASLKEAIEAVEVCMKMGFSDGKPIEEILGDGHETEPDPLPEFPPTDDLPDTGESPRSLD